MRNLKIKIYRAKGKSQWAIHVKSSNGKILVDASGYDCPATAVSSLHSLACHFEAGKASVKIEYPGGDSAQVPLGINRQKTKTRISSKISNANLVELSRLWP